ncbi:MAG TPA: regulatory protein RecX [Candidatus Limnocylindrales bacterium]
MQARRPPRDSPAARRARHADITDVAAVVDAGARFLQARPRSAAEVRRRLTVGGYRPELVEAAVERLTELRYLDDEAFARAWVGSRDRARPRGERALRAELIEKGIARDVIDAVLAERAVGGSGAMGGSGAPGQPDDRAAWDPDEGTAGDAEARAPGGPEERAARALLDRRRPALARISDRRVRRQRAYALLARHGFDPELAGRLASELSLEP